MSSPFRTYADRVRRPTGIAPVGRPDVVPTGTIADVLAWVGESPTRARAAYDVEVAKASPRSTLVAELEARGTTP